VTAALPLADLFSLQGRVALVTGASSGIGRAAAAVFAEAGACVVLLARRESALDAAVRAIEAAGGRAAAVACDLADRAGIPDALARAIACFGPPDILLNAAGINPRAPVESVTPDAWDRTLEINLSVPFFLAQRLAPAMCERGYGRLINIASLQSVLALPDGAPYGASKGGVMQLTRALAKAWSAQGVTCNAIAPGFFPTELTAAVFADPVRAAAMAARTMVGRNGVLDDLRGTLVYLASGASAYVTGQTLFVDGGFTAG
jgi:NAD(P)-dependent dehydrogenase (short-subunit alcohol dehydrogenase family)